MSSSTTTAGGQTGACPRARPMWPDLCTSCCCHGNSNKWQRSVCRLPRYSFSSLLLASLLSLLLLPLSSLLLDSVQHVSLLLSPTTALSHPLFLPPQPVCIMSPHGGGRAGCVCAASAAYELMTSPEPEPQCWEMESHILDQVHAHVTSSIRHVTSSMCHVTKQHNVHVISSICHVTSSMCHVTGNTADSQQSIIT